MSDLDVGRMRVLHDEVRQYLAMGFYDMAIGGGDGNMRARATERDFLQKVNDALPALLDAAEESQTLLRERDAALAECRTRGIELDHARTAGPPGLWRCPRCNFVCVRSSLNALDGSITANYEEPDPCPNDGEHLNRVTWREHADDMEARCAEQMERAAQAEKERDDARAKLDAVKGVRELIGILLDAWEQVPNDAKTDEWGHVNNLLAQLSWEIEQDAALTPTKESDRDN